MKDFEISGFKDDPIVKKLQQRERELEKEKFEKERLLKNKAKAYFKKKDEQRIMGIK